MYRIMTVCTGNICRSPVGEYLIREHARQAGLEVEVASSAITDYEIGNPYRHPRRAHTHHARHRPQRAPRIQIRC